ncbi:MAG: hypothetical protein D6683_08465 [Actinomyces sp.]|nr:MAG: hypothetical protein D6683_08465 [Actinomyces sp.]
MGLIPSHRRSRIAALSFAVLLSSCGGNGESPGTAPDGSGAVPPAQAAALEDGVVTRAEIEEAYQRTVDCLVAAGFEHVEYTRDNDRVYSLQFDASGPPAGMSEDDYEQQINAAAEACATENLNATSDVWLRQTELSEEQKQAEARRLAACVADYGIEVTGPDAAGLRPLVERLGELEKAGQENTPEWETLNSCFQAFALVAGGAPD